MKLSRNLIISNAVYNALASVTGRVLGILVLPAFVANLGADMYGIWVLASMLVGYLRIFDFGFTKGLQRYIASASVQEDEDELSRVVSTGTAMLGLIGLVLGVLVIGIRYPIMDFFHVSAANREQAATVLLVAGIACLLHWPLKMPAVVLQATLRIRALSILRCVESIAIPLLMLALVLMSRSIVTIKISVAGTTILFLLLQAVVALKSVPGLRVSLRRCSLACLYKIAPFSLGLFYMSVLTMLAIRIDNFVVAAMLGTVAVTHYVVASKLFELCYFVLLTSSATLMPTLFNLVAAKDTVRIQKALNHSIKYRITAVTPLIFLGMIIAPTFLGLWMGPEYVGLSAWSRVYLLSLFLFVTGIGSNLAATAGYNWQRNAVATVRVIVNLGLSIALTRRYGVGGPILGTVISFLVVGDFLFFPYYCRLVGVRWQYGIRSVLRVILFGSVPALSGWIITQQLFPLRTWLELGGFAGLFLVMSYALIFVFCFDSEEKRDVYLALQSVGLSRVPGVGHAARYLCGC